MINSPEYNYGLQVGIPDSDFKLIYTKYVVFVTVYALKSLSIVVANQVMASHATK